MVLTTPSPHQVDSKGVIGYVVLAFAISWGWWIGMAVLGATSRPGEAWPTHLIGLLGPAIAAIIVTGRRQGRAGLKDLARRCVTTRTWALWFVVALLALALGALRLNRLLGHPMPTWESLTTYNGAPLLPLPLLFLYALVINGFGEEVGWRGYLVEELLPRFGVLKAAGITWVVWALWHLPLFFVTESFQAMSPALTVGWLIAMGAGSIVLAALYVHAGHSILLVALWHTTFNFVSGTPGAEGIMAATVSTAVMAFAVLIVIRRGSIL